MSRSKFGNAVARHVPGGALLVALAGLAMGLARVGWRFRRQLAPVAIWAALLGIGLALRTWAPVTWLEGPIWTGIAGAVFVWFAGPRVSAPLRRVVAFLVPDALDDGRRGVLDRPTERAYLALLLIYGGTWTGLVATYGAVEVLLWGGGIGFVGFSAPWWWHRRIRRTGRLNVYARKWPQVAEHVLPFAESRVLPEGVQKLGGRGGAVVLDVRLRTGRTVESVGAYASNIASVFGLRAGAVTIGPGRTANRITVRVVPRDPWAKEITHPAIEHPGTIALADSADLPMGLFDDGELVLFTLQHALVVGQSGSGKSTWLEALLVWLFSSEDAVVVGADLANGATLGVWEPLLAVPLATTPEEAFALLQGLLALVDDREQVLASRKRKAGAGGADDTIQPSADMPWVVAIIDEFPDLVAAGGKPVIDLIGRIGKRARKARVTLILGAQNATKADVGSTELRGQLRSTVAFKLDGQQSKNLWGDLRKSGWDSVPLPVGVYLLRDDQHSAPRQTKGWYLRKDQRAKFIRRVTGRPVRLDDGGLRALTGGGPVIDAEVEVPGGPVRAHAERLAEPRPALTSVAAIEPDPGTEPERVNLDEFLPNALVTACRKAGPTGVSVADLNTIGKDHSVDRFAVDRKLRALDRDGVLRKLGRGRWAAR